MSHHFIDRSTPLMAFYGALWHIGRKRVRYDNDGVFGILFFESASVTKGRSRIGCVCACACACAWNSG